MNYINQIIFVEEEFLSLHQSLDQHLEVIIVLKTIFI